MSAWDQQPGESSRAYERFVGYLQLGPDRSLSKLVGELGQAEHYLTQLKRWSSQFNWVARAREFDQHELGQQLSDRHEVRELARQVAVDHAREMLGVMVELARGRDDEGNETAPPSVRLQAAIKVAELAGIIAPKRVEISGPDGKEIQLAARRTASGLSDEQLAQLEASLLAMQAADDA